ncbi:hypothetical protein [Streptomyces roseochromogenus]|uniref:Uncharacterized protein n=1 Tax=Streptomyces roseochromogenus subsp. oscitans DS 12.976 TaxID=1352936 RepID=V6KNP9_STRRC|nr:hypothetical protein [Streptomyces roseochromogenus]EST30634.1 hypothetical protein M878_18120 [Streptomyces roseochromogenus subsp. oscitans DS 12.976]
MPERTATATTGNVRASRASSSGTTCPARHGEVCALLDGTPEDRAFLVLFADLCTPIPAAWDD